MVVQNENGPCCARASERKSKYNNALACNFNEFPRLRQSNARVTNLFFIFRNTHPLFHCCFWRASVSITRYTYTMASILLLLFCVLAKLLELIYVIILFYVIIIYSESIKNAVHAITDAVTVGFGAAVSPFEKWKIHLSPSRSHFPSPQHHNTIVPVDWNLLPARHVQVRRVCVCVYF